MSESDLRILRQLPRRFLEVGYLDAIAAFGGLHANQRAVAAQLDVLPAPARVLVAVFFLGGHATRGELAAALGEEIVDALLSLGVLFSTDAGMNSGGLVALPVLGSLGFISSDATRARDHFGDETASLLMRLAPAAGQSFLGVGPGAGLFALRAGHLASELVAVEPTEIGSAIAELGFAMNGLAGEVRCGRLPDALETGERFRCIAAASTTAPFRLRRADQSVIDDGPTTSLELLRAIPAALDGEGMAQLAAVWHGDDGGPKLDFDVDAFAAEAGLEIAITCPSRQPIIRGSPIFRAVAAAVAGASTTPVSAIERGFDDDLRRTGALFLYLSFMTVTRSGRPSVTISRHFRHPGGSWIR